jgi:formylglycine-generating enzyme required for sulfatase activity
MSVYWLLTGLKPGANYRPPSGIVPGLNPGWDIFLARCLTRERSKRYSNAKLALRDLDHLSELGTPGYADDIAGDIPSAKGGAKTLVRKNLVVGALVGALVAGVAGTACYFVFLDDDAGGDQVAQNSPVTRHAGDGQPAITLKISPDTSRVGVMPGGAEFSVKSGQLLLDAKPGKYTLTFTSNGLVTQRIPIEVLDKKPTTRNIVMFKEGGTLEVTSIPRATLSLEREKGSSFALGETDANGKFSAQAGIGTYTLIVEKKDCPTARIPGVVVKSKELTSLSVELEGATASLVLTSNPTGAKVTLDGEDVGTTPITLEKLKPGRPLNFVISKESYRTLTRKIVLDAGERKNVDAGTLLPAIGTIAYRLRLSGREPTAAELANITLSRNDDGLRQHTWKEALAMPKQVAVGQYMVKAEHPDYEPFQSAFAVEDDRTSTVDINLRAIPSKFELTGIPSGVKYTLRINNREYTEAPAEVPADVPLHITIEARDYETWTGEFTARPRRPFVLNAPIKRLGPPATGAAYTLPYINTKLVWVPPGETKLGSPSDEVGHTGVEEPATLANFTKGFWMSRTEVTQEEYERVLGANPSSFRGKGRPVENVTHTDAIRFCKALNKREQEAGRIPFGFEYRLPNEVEWEYACRAGRTTAFSFGASAKAVNGNFVGTYPEPGRTIAASTAATKAVGSYPENAYGLCDMHGNVREWLLEPYKGHLPGGRKVDYNIRYDDLSGNTYGVRGGSWNTVAKEARSAFRPSAGLPEDTIADDLGFRVVLAPVTLP